MMNDKDMLAVLISDEFAQFLFFFGKVQKLA